MRRSWRTGEAGRFNSVRVAERAVSRVLITRWCAALSFNGSTRLPEHASATVEKEKLRFDRFSSSSDLTNSLSFFSWLGFSAGLQVANSNTVQAVPATQSSG